MHMLWQAGSASEDVAAECKDLGPVHTPYDVVM